MQIVFHVPLSGKSKKSDSHSNNATGPSPQEVKTLEQSLCQYDSGSPEQSEQIIFH